MAALLGNFRKCKLTNSRSALEYAKHVCSVFFVTSYLKNSILLLRVSLFWTEFIGKLLIGDHFIPMKKIQSSRKNTTFLFDRKIRHFPDLPVLSNSRLFVHKAPSIAKTYQKILIVKK